MWQGGAGRAQVYKAVLDCTQPVAVKKLLRSDDRLDAKFLREIAILKECHSTQVVQVHTPPAPPPLPVTPGARARALQPVVALLLNESRTLVRPKGCSQLGSCLPNTPWEVRGRACEKKGGR